MNDPANQKRLLALELLKKTGIWKSSYQPPMINLLWRLGIDVRPPHFIPFFQAALFTGLPFGISWTLCMVMFGWFSTNGSNISTTAIGVITGSLFGFAMAGYYAHGRWRHNLPKWESIG